MSLRWKAIWKAILDIPAPQRGGFVLFVMISTMFILSILLLILFSPYLTHLCQTNCVPFSVPK